MKLLNGLKDSFLLPNKVVATIGNFDGVHKGHQELINTLKIKSQELKCPLLVILFEPQPQEFFNYEDAPPRLTHLREKLKIFKNLGVDFICCLKFNKNLSKIPACDFAEKIIFKSLNVSYLLIGSDFRFGYNRQGDINLLIDIGKKYYAIIDTFPDYIINDKRISSTEIRKLLQAGNLELATNYLNGVYTICGRVITGDGLGRKIGFPTANVLIHKKLPLSGVFIVKVKIIDSTNLNKNDIIYQGVANVGIRPTINNKLKLNLEIHLIDFNKSIYGKRIEVMFLKKLRNETKFDSITKLIEQITKDKLETIKWFSLVDV